MYNLPKFWKDVKTMLNKEIAQLLNEQINKEFYSAYLYLGISSYYTSKNLNGFANWFNVQAQEERDHGMLIVKYLENNSEELDLMDILASKEKYTDLARPLAATLDHERIVTASINNIYAASMAIKDFRTMQFLDWFIKEQGEEEKNSEELVKKYALFGKDGKGLYMFDAELAARIYMPPSLVI